MIATFWESMTWATGTCSVAMLALWALQLRLRDAGLVDLGWAACIGALAVGYAVTSDGAPAQRFLAGIIGGFWGFRLALHLLVDRVAGGEEDGRYRYLRAHWGRHADLQFLWFFLGQGLLAVAFSLPYFLIAGIADPRIAPVQWVGLSLVAVGLLGEAVADRQLARFRGRPENRGKTCRSGLWRYSRHPNYFFEWLIWCAVALLAWPAPHGGWALLAPAAMYLFITKITGIPYTEAQALRSRGSDYRAYQFETNAFFPGPTRQGVSR